MSDITGGLTFQVKTFVSFNFKTSVLEKSNSG